MRRTTKIAAVAVVTAIALTGCSKKSDTSATDASSSASDDICKTADGDGPMIGLAYDVGGRGDQSFNDSAYAGVSKAVEEFDGSCVEGEAEDGEAESAREDRLRQMADAGATAIIGVGFAYSDSVNAVAPDYPDVNFAVVDGYDPDSKANDNVAYFSFAANESSYLVGVAAALTTQTDEVGFVGGVHNDLIKAFEAGYTAGVHAVNPDIQVDVAYIEESDLSGFSDPAGGKTAAAGEFDKGADVVYHAAGASGSGVFDAAVEAGDGMWAIGVDSDQYLTATSTQQPHILTSALKRVDVASYDFIKSVNEGTPDTSYVTYDLTNDGVGYSTSGGFLDDVSDQIDEYASKIKSGDITVPTAP
ncbi:BMP family ABC transporter substrate-binding protein [Nocardioides sp. GY 10127]|uniref:BMP family lipoprotein n=1 Tax=Nocardioides sp. GY 10127 TaxID=2569762 RepID=UPI0010A8F8C0|nr:BMP family ABC transporter substrate-binding protein [Nocardioides sp. GY 10127]TIC84292.1 BMP family ABC transporter substrate-binding protein [Nocardioides sp. GY 10127]